VTGKTVGVLGGMGPDATVDFMASVIALTPANKDQDHIRMIVDHNPQVPDRQAALRGDRSAVVGTLIGMALRLESAGADFLVMPCNTAHAFLGDVIPAIHVPFLHIIDETVGEVASQHPDSKKIGVMATTACIDTGIYQSALQAKGRSSLMPSGNQQPELMELIFRIKRGDKGTGVRKSMRQIAMLLESAGAELIVAACTEIPLVMGAADFDIPFVSSTEVLARRTIALAIEEPGLMPDRS